MPRTTIIMLTWNALRYTQITLVSLLKSKDDFDLIIFDNASRHETREYLNSIKDSRIKRIIFSNNNLGVWRGRYKASQLVMTPLICFIDNDVCFPTQWLNKLEKELLQDSKVGEVGPLKLSNHVMHPYINNNIKSVWHNCERSDIDPFKQFISFTMNRNFDDYVKDLIRVNKQMDRELEIPTRSIGGSVMLTKTELYRNAQINDNYYSKFKYGLEDMDYSWSLFKSGYKVIKCTDVYVHHFEHSSVDENNLNINSEEENHGLIYFTTKWENFVIDWINRKRNEGQNLNDIKKDEFINLILRVIPSKIPHRLKNILSNEH